MSLNTVGRDHKGQSIGMNPARDVANVVPMSAEMMLAHTRWDLMNDDQRKFWTAFGVNEKDSRIAYERWMNLVYCMGIPGMAGPKGEEHPQIAVDKSGFDHMPYASQVFALQAMGRVIMSAFFTMIREASLNELPESFQKFCNYMMMWAQAYHPSVNPHSPAGPQG